MYKKVLFSISTLLVIIILFLAAFPSLISTSWGKEMFLNLVNSHIPGSISLKEWQLSWLGNQYVKEVELRDADNQVILHCKKFTTKMNVLHYFKKNYLQSTGFEGLSGALVFEKSGETNIQQAITPPQFYPLSSEALKEEIFITILHASGKLIPSLDFMQFEVKGETNDKGVVGNFEMITAVKGNESLELNAQIVHFPTQILDLIIAQIKPKYQNLATALLGNEVNLLIDQTRNKEISFIDMQILSPHFKGNLKGKFLNGQFVLEQPAIQSINLTPFFSFYSIDKQIQGQVTIQELALTINPSEESFLLNTALNIESDLALENFPMNNFRVSTHVSLGRNGIASIRNLNFYGSFANVAVPMHIFLDSLEYSFSK